MNKNYKSEFSVSIHNVRNVNNVNNVNTNFIEKNNVLFNKVLSEFSSTKPINQNLEASGIIELEETTPQNSLLDIYTKYSDNISLYSILCNQFTEYTKFTFSNTKYTIDLYCFDYRYFCLDCFNMNTITLQVYKKLIYEIYELIIKEHNKNRIYLSKDIKTLYVFIDNIDKLEINKINIIHSILCNQLFYSNNTPQIHCACIHYFVTSDLSNFYYSENNRKALYLFLSENTEILEISNLDVLNKRIKIENLFIELGSLDDNEKHTCLEKFIQELFCNERYSIFYIEYIFNYTITHIINNVKQCKNRVLLLENAVVYLNEFYELNKLNTMKHLLYENYMCNMISIYKQV